MTESGFKSMDPDQVIDQIRLITQFPSIAIMYVSVNRRYTWDTVFIQ